MAISGAPAGRDATELRGRTERWGGARTLLLALLVLAAFWLRARGLAAEGFADDEIHKWLAANRYLSGQFGGDDVEHPMLMKSLVAITVAALRGALAPEALTRLPNVLGGALTVLATALLGRRLFGRAAALLGAALVALSTTVVGYHRIAKEDVYLGLFLVLFLWCVAEAKAAADDGRAAESQRWEAWSAAAIGAAFASKYFVYYLPIPFLAYAWLRPVSTWRVPLRRWLVLGLLATGVFLLLNWSPLLPGTLDYIRQYMGGNPGGALGSDRGVSESLLFMGRLYGNLPLTLDSTPWWFFLAFAAVKWAPLTAALMAAGIALAIARRRPAHRIVLVWIGVFYVCILIGSGKYGRFFISQMPAYLLLAAHAAMELGRWLAARVASRAPAAVARAAPAALALAVAAPEVAATLTHAPHHRLYLSPLAGGDAAVTWFLPHCDYFDAGVREAMAWVSARAEPGAEVVSDVDWSVRLYAERNGRADLVSSPMFAARACRLGKPCYALVQVGRLYRHNEAAVRRLEAVAPAHVERIRGTDAVRVYRLAPGEPLFPPERVAGSAAPPR